MKTHLILLALCAISCVAPAQQTNAVDTVKLKHVAEQALNESFSYGATSGRVMVMDVATGHLLLDYTAEMQNSTPTAVAAKDNAIEPGSLLATALVATLLDDPTVRLDTAMPLCVTPQIYPTGGNGMTVKDVHRWDVDSLPLHTVFSVSSSVGFCELGNKYYASIPDSLGARLRHLFPSAKMNSFSDPKMLYRLCMGYGITLSPTDILTFYTALANRGVNPLSGRRVCSVQTANLMKALLREVVEKGTARSIQTNDYSIAGKTALVATHPSLPRHSAMFAGFFPSGNPRYACLVILKESDNSNRATKVFKMVSDHLMDTNK